MSEIFEDDEDKVLINDDGLADAEEILADQHVRIVSDARRRLEDLMEEKRLRDELEDFPDE